MRRRKQVAQQFRKKGACPDQGEEDGMEHMHGLRMRDGCWDAQ